MPSEAAPAQPAIVTYRYNGKLVYVTPPSTYEEAVASARDLFPELASVDPQRIGISINAMVSKKRELIRISPMAWQPVLASRKQYEVLDITLHNPKIIVHDAEQPPAYLDATEKGWFDLVLDPSRAPSPINGHTFIPFPGSKTKPRTSSSSPTSPCCPPKSPVGWAMSLLGKKSD
ncbi:hypothetical protein BN946_scf184709.g2 [Trametes cinnabarina]|uniref:Uncharacterized protein n=1 Tax=Pycnoporus cinnabarinus TaxID=5643 RepID=A0A060SRE7_PYCCI|nr:hypothetical protein BN946_scf184709.g2 [Trametes cinnabarina]